MGTAERKLEIIKYICRARRTTMSQLAKEFGVSVRTIQRDIIYLSGEMHIPIYCQYGKYDGGVYIDEDYKWDKMYMTTEQIGLLVKMGQIAGDKLSEKEKLIFLELIKVYSVPVLN